MKPTFENKSAHIIFKCLILPHTKMLFNAEVQIITKKYTFLY